MSLSQSVISDIDIEIITYTAYKDIEIITYIVYIDILVISK